MATSKLLLVSAVAFEATSTLEVLKRCGVEHEYFEVGIGPINAAKSLAQLKEKAKNTDVIYIGSAGTFASFKKPYLVKVDDVYWMPTAERMGLAKNMVDLHRPISFPRSRKLDLPSKTVLTSSSVSLSNEVAVSGLPSRDDLIENMELYSVASELIEEARSVEVIMGITNGVGPDGSKEWLKNFKSISTSTADFLEKYLCR